MSRESGGGASRGLKLRCRGEGPGVTGTGSSPDHPLELPLAVGVRVVLYSELLEREITVKLSHTGEDRLGGHLVENPTSPLVQRGDHVHFRRCHVMRRLG